VIGNGGPGHCAWFVGTLAMKKCARISPMQILLNRRPQFVPTAYWRRLKWLQFSALLYAIAWLAYGVFAFGLIWSRAATLIFLILWGVFMFVLDLGPRLVDRRLRKDVLANHFQICTHCGYTLSGLPTKHRCPECGVEYDSSQLREQWEEWFS
jgi:predicted RNA-binding Zn-ribbon protein involved in translation (DUF1610 family)